MLSYEARIRHVKERIGIKYVYDTNSSNYTLDTCLIHGFAYFFPFLKKKIGYTYLMKRYIKGHTRSINFMFRPAQMRSPKDF